MVRIAGRRVSEADLAFLGIFEQVSRDEWLETRRVAAEAANRLPDTVALIQEG